MKIRHEHIESVLLALAAEKGQAWVANAITEEYLRQGGGAANCPLYQARTGTISRISITVG